MDAGGRADAGHDADGSDPLPVPEPPRLSDWACPEGWLPSPYGEGEPWAFSACAPPVRRECDGASRQLPGEAECRRLGTPCPETEDGLPTEADLRSLAPGFEGEIRYVRAEAPGGGDGSRDAPFSTLADALERPGSGVIVALAPGVHRARAAVRGSVAVVGSCVGETTVQALPLRGGELPYQATLLLGDGDVLATNLRLTGARVGIRVENGLGTATVRSVLVEAAAWVGIIVIRSSPGILLEDVVVRDVVPPPADRFAAGLVVTESGGVRLRGAP